MTAIADWWRVVRLLHHLRKHEAQPDTHPDHQWVWVDGNNVDAVVIYREWQHYQRASSRRWEADSP